LKNDFVKTRPEPRFFTEWFDSTTRVTINNQLHSSAVPSSRGRLRWA